jgi:hypothetical protein
MRVCSGQAGAELALFPEFRATRGTTNRQRFFLFNFHAYTMRDKSSTRWSIVTIGDRSPGATPSPRRRISKCKHKSMRLDCCRLLRCGHRRPKAFRQRRSSSIWPNCARLSGRCNGMRGKRRAHDLRDCPRYLSSPSATWRILALCRLSRYELRNRTEGETARADFLGEFRAVG